MWLLSSRGGGGKALVAGSLKKTFSAASLSNCTFTAQYSNFTSNLLFYAEEMFKSFSFWPTCRKHGISSEDLKDGEKFIISKFCIVCKNFSSHQQVTAYELQKWEQKWEEKMNRNDCSEKNILDYCPSTLRNKSNSFYFYLCYPLNLWGGGGGGGGGWEGALYAFHLLWFFAIYSKYL